MLPDMKLALSIHLQATHQFSSSVCRDRMASSEFDTDDCTGIAVALGVKRMQNRYKWSKSWLLEKNKHSHINLLEELCLEHRIILII